jgi:hypothetical protein
MSPKAAMGAWGALNRDWREVAIVHAEAFAISFLKTKQSLLFKLARGVVLLDTTCRLTFRELSFGNNAIEGPSHCDKPCNATAPPYTVIYRRLLALCYTSHTGEFTPKRRCRVHISQQAGPKHRPSTSRRQLPLISKGFPSLYLPRRSYRL